MFTVKAKVNSSYRTHYPHPLKLKSGDQVKIEKRKCEWKGWVWCEGKDGNTGWIPENYLQIKGNNGKLLLDYDATELTVQRGEELKIIKEESGWFWCKNQKGDYGWIPKEKLRLR
ncbi:MAG: SH3 domain-containing protein [candidate division Zixibacteria bacterium]|nr:SH3 domain-containing protein [candidate division Zixibacteria bacterium]